MREAGVVTGGRQYAPHPVLEQAEFGSREGHGEGRGLLPDGRLGGHLTAQDAKQPRLALPTEGLRAVDGAGEEGLREQPPGEGALGGLSEGGVQLLLVAYRPHVAGGGARRVLQDRGQTDLAEDLGGCGGMGGVGGIGGIGGDGQGRATAQAALMQEGTHPALVAQQPDRGRVRPGQAQFGGQVGARNAPGVGRVDEPSQIGHCGQCGGARGLVERVDVDDVECRECFGCEVGEFVAVDGPVPGEQAQPVPGPAGRLRQAAQSEGECFQGGDGHDARSSLLVAAVDTAADTSAETPVDRAADTPADVAADASAVVAVGAASGAGTRAGAALRRTS